MTSVKLVWLKKYHLINSAGERFVSGLLVSRTIDLFGFMRDSDCEPEQKIAQQSHM